MSGSSLYACATTSGYQQFLTSLGVSPTGRSLVTTVTWDNPVGVHDGKFPCCRLGLLQKASACCVTSPGDVVSQNHIVSTLAKRPLALEAL